ncbi:MAG TPA: glycoside hydrolase family 15 protein [Candidatus Sulfotelmatobacter sp.]|jgi:GH15 family glucan-1,4-alpha-glucosidase|nr:glycoside hydrolase family 15 protein [Candidatus Sulfotelmatobacter sp.]
MNYQPIENYGLIGDLTTAALVGQNGSIDFMCFPRFDSPTIFAALLDRERGGYFQLAPAEGDFRYHQRYLPETNILLSRFLGDGVIAQVSDFMAMQHLGNRHDLVRRVKLIRGRAKFRMVFKPKFDYGRSGHRIEKKAHEAVIIPDDKRQPPLRLRSTVPLKVQDGALVADFLMKKDEVASFILEEADGGEDSPSRHPDYVTESFKETMNYWLAWSAQCNYRGRWREMILRSALLLKLMTSQPHGAIVAAPTFGLPEEIGGKRNWDYRYTWIRDASLTLYALMRLGYTGEAKDFMGWMEKRCRELRPGEPLQVMYRVGGRDHLPERVLKNFEGYKRSSPVRIGNAASEQLQLDMYGELMDSVYIYNRHGEPISHDFWSSLVNLTEFVCKNWRKPDEGIWEVRGGPKEFLHSRAMCWLTIDRAMKIARDRSFPAPLVRWHRTKDEIYKNIFDKFWDPKLKSFVQFRGAKTVDASALLLPLVKFISPTDPRWKSTMEVIKKQLVDDSLVYRYKPDRAAPDGIGGCEGTFSMCSFWYVECLARGGDLREARFIFEKALGYANHLGLYAEQLGPGGEHMGNFPQALSHISLISAAWALDNALSGPGKPAFQP